jgi:uncharacterized protein (TIGR01777 family)
MENNEKGIGEESVLITGGSGLVGRYLTSLLLSEGYRVSHLSRKANHFGRVRVHRWDIEKGILDPAVLEGVDYIIHLSGANIGEKRWTKDRKREIADSRVLSTRLLYEAALSSGCRLKAFISASATGYYGSITSTRLFSEVEPPATDFLGDVCRKWEEQADLFGSISSRVVKVRTAVVLEKSDSALSKYLHPAKFGIFPVLGSGRQYMPWIHISDLCRIYLKAVMDNKMSGAYNAVAPSHNDQRSFMKTLASVLDKTFFAPPVPAFLLNIFMGEMSAVVLKGSRISSDKIISAGYNFQYPDLLSALQNAISD